MTRSPEIPPLPFTSLGDCPAHWASLKPDAIAVHHRDKSLTWRELAESVRRLAAGLQSRGVVEGDMVSFALPNGFDIVVGSFACWMIGAIPQVLSMNLTADEFGPILATGNPRVVCTLDGENAACPTGVLQTTVTELSEAAPTDVRVVEAISPAWKAPTSGGSTGRPKIILSATPGIVDLLPLQVWDIAPTDILLVSAPMHHNSPFSVAMHVLTVGGTLTLLDRFDPEDVLKEIQGRRITWLYAVPTMMHRMYRLDSAVRSEYDLSSLRSVWHVGAPCAGWLKHAWIDWIGAEKIWELYAGTEGQAGTRINGAEWLHHEGSVGRTLWGHIKIVAPDDTDAEAGVVGEVYMRSSSSEATYRYIGAEPKRMGDWETLGDIGYFDSDGYLYLKDRTTDMILIGGENVYPAEIEAALDQFPGVRSSAVIGLPDEDLGSRVHAIIEVCEPLDLDDLRNFLESKLTRKKRPASLEIVVHPLRDTAGKIRRARLREERLPHRGEPFGASDG